MLWKIHHLIHNMLVSLSILRALWGLWECCSFRWKIESNCRSMIHWDCLKFKLWIKRKSVYFSTWMGFGDSYFDRFGWLTHILCSHEIKAWKRGQLCWNSNLTKIWGNIKRVSFGSPPQDGLKIQRYSLTWNKVDPKSITNYSWV